MSNLSATSTHEKVMQCQEMLFVRSGDVSGDFRLSIYAGASQKCISDSNMLTRDETCFAGGTYDVEALKILLSNLYYSHIGV